MPGKNRVSSSMLTPIFAHTVHNHLGTLLYLDTRLGV
jgi:hypothetical protein